MNDLLGDRLKRLRKEKNLKQEQVADIIGVNKRQISAYENNVRQPSYEILVRFAALYKVSTDYLLGCKPNSTLDVTGLTFIEYNVLSDLVEILQNKKTNDK